jgi:hypothetical protein
LYSAYFSFFLIGKLKNLFFALFYLFIIFYFDCHTYYTEEKLWKSDSVKNCLKRWTLAGFCFVLPAL